MEVSQARGFLAVAEELHFGRAAERLHTAQSALSRLIQQLEADLGAPLFERTTRSVALTPQGEALVEPARELVALAERSHEIVRRAAAGETGRLRVGFAGASVHHLVAELARGLRRERPGLVVDLQSAQFSHPGLERLREGTLDVLIGRWDFLPDGVDSLVISRERLLVALPSAHRLARRRQLAAADVANEPWIVLPGGSGATLSNRLQLLGMRGRFVPRVVQTVPDSATELLLVEAGVGLALTLSGVRDNHPAGAVTFLPLAADLGAVEVRLAWNGRSASPAVTAAIDTARRLFTAAS
ncbi:LysR substrate-binding domain-containing protein [Microbacterium sp.]|uniref:LysR substrate-binding domain-containing protein n=1 Tax=Microbacterium sp. TaxID=51671 RepID=UPI003A865876